MSYDDTMTELLISSGTVHNLPADLSDLLKEQDDALAAWNDITPLARNEFICWIESAKQLPTRHRRLNRTIEELIEGKRRPCCWAGCLHRQKISMPKSNK